MYIPQCSLSLELRLDWSEQDTFLHINNVAYFKYTQAARLKLLERVGLVEMHQTENIGPTLGNTQCKFIKPLFYPGNIVVNSFIKEIKNTSFIIQHIIIDDDSEIAATAEDVIVVYDYSEETKQNIPKEVAKELHKLLS
jgi:acyl-CoA thioester hydrolase